MTKKEYMNPEMNVIRIQQRQIICASQDGMNTSLQEEMVTSAWGRRGNTWDDEEDE